ncbi:MAG: baseplate J/gp47 family protein, partial [Anaerotignum sp.]|nr:baseplate J/gp47 family protein [Anaerotignum sp.]
ECETAGACGNDYLGNLLPLETMMGLAEATLTELRTDGEDEEGDEELRKRYFASFDADAFGGNIADYKSKVNALQNVGGVKVYPAWNGGGTVKVVIIDQGWRAPTETELSELQDRIDPESRGEGYGIAPIGHRVTVDGVTEVPCRISMNLSLAEGAVQETVLADIQGRFEVYFEEMRKNWADSTYLTVRISYLEARALEAEGVVDISDCSINGGSGNLVLGADEVPVLGEIGVNA